MCYQAPVQLQEPLRPDQDSCFDQYSSPVLHASLLTVNVPLPLYVELGMVRVCISGSGNRVNVVPAAAGPFDESISFC
jgi:hypothetical protein